jgi:chitosanase
MLDDLQVRTAQAIVNIFETSQPLGDYAKVTLIKNDTGHLTYGRSQTTLASGNLYLLIKAYCDRQDAELASELNRYLDRLANCDLSLDMDMGFRALLREAGGDPCMHETQDRFFDRVYWTPSVRDATVVGVTSALGTSVVYDSHVHGSWGHVREITNGNHGPASSIGEEKWISFYIAERRNWLANHANSALHPTVYRMDAFKDLIKDRKWELPLPIAVRGVRIDKDVLLAGVPVRVSAHDTTQRTLRLQVPFLVGDDVEAVQRALVKSEIAVDIDGIYGNLTEAAVRRFQQQKGLVADGIVGPATSSALGL